jgi:soluble cytochrome b562
MKTRRNRGRRRRNTLKKYSGKKSGKKWVTAIDAAQKTLRKTGNIEAARKSLRKQALTNARKLFGSVSSNM